MQLQPASTKKQEFETCEWRDSQVPGIRDASARSTVALFKSGVGDASLNRDRHRSPLESIDMYCRVTEMTLEEFESFAPARRAMGSTVAANVSPGLQRSRGIEVRTVLPISVKASRERT